MCNWSWGTSDRWGYSSCQVLLTDDDLDNPQHPQRLLKVSSGSAALPMGLHVCHFPVVQLAVSNCLWGTGPLSRVSSALTFKWSWSRWGKRGHLTWKMVWYNCQIQSDCSFRSLTAGSMSSSFFSQRPPSSPLENDVIKLCLMLSWCDSEIPNTF